jgi:hypothetical protein
MKRNKMQKSKLDWLLSEIPKGIDDLDAGRFKDGRIVMSETKDLLLKMKRKSTHQTKYSTGTRSDK